MKQNGNVILKKTPCCVQESKISSKKQQNRIDVFKKTNTIYFSVPFTRLFIIDLCLVFVNVKIVIQQIYFAATQNN